MTIGAEAIGGHPIGGEDYFSFASAPTIDPANSECAAASDVVTLTQQHNLSVHNSEQGQGAAQADVQMVIGTIIYVADSECGQEAERPTLMYVDAVFVVPADSQGHQIADDILAQVLSLSPDGSEQEQSIDVLAASLARMILPHNSGQEQYIDEGILLSIVGIKFEGKIIMYPGLRGDVVIH